ncbi:hypothetical protein HSRCO_1155 [Halanaeroarchaeum sp. HSR-CO]|uniref:hypothetical protein n=1 Tax=Halanaeroarchaeum sp. HSR-CO TaxID=2866382 RepID=UPI00217DF47C|nr:hypothetical protein [Halanaeroarchaeum sp. HSR-CO]UWG47442.1 hypothetical protein HSRCO_1155 [Halanaeroarchaeum sp. HSR-CO]
MSNNRRNVYLPDELAEYVDEYEIPLSKLLQEKVEDYQLRHTGNRERLQRQIRENELAITEKKAEIDELRSENEELRERLNQIEEASENRYESVRNLLDKLVSVSPERREKFVMKSDIQIPTVKVMDIVDAVNLHYCSSNGERREEDYERMIDAVDEAGLEYKISPFYDESCKEWLSSQMLPDEKSKFEEEWGKRFVDNQ